MNIKFYQSARRALGHRIGFTPCLFGFGAQLLLCACSSQGSSFGSGAGGSDTAPGGAAGASGDVGGAMSGGGDTSGGGIGGIPGAGGAGPGAGGTAGESGSGGTAGAGATVSGGGAAGATASGGSAGTGDVCPKPAGQICHEFFANDNSRNETHYVNEFSPSKNWTVGVGDSGQNSPRGAQLVDNAKAKSGKAVLISIDKGFAELDAVDGTQLSKVTSFGSVTSAIRIPPGATATQFPGATVLARDLNPPELDIVDSAGKALTPALKLPFASGGTELRKLERNPTTGNFTLTKYESGTTAFIYEVTEQGSQAAKIQLPVGAKGYNAIWLNGGGLIGSTGSLSTVVTLDASGKVTNTVGGKGVFKDSTGATIFTDFFSGVFNLPNGNVVAANWLGHVDPSTHKTTPELLEITPGNQLVWSWGNQSIATYITYGYFLR